MSSVLVAQFECEEGAERRIAGSESLRQDDRIRPDLPPVRVTLGPIGRVSIAVVLFRKPYAPIAFGSIPSLLIACRLPGLRLARPLGHPGDR
jgi:hypothetical protein